jgi:hypothetical protein
MDICGILFYARRSSPLSRVVLAVCTGTPFLECNFMSIRHWGKLSRLSLDKKGCSLFLLCDAHHRIGSHNAQFGYLFTVFTIFKLRFSSSFFFF